MRSASAVQLPRASCAVDVVVVLGLNVWLCLVDQEATARVGVTLELKERVEPCGGVHGGRSPTPAC
jgi:hypothetical protein